MLNENYIKSVYPDNPWFGNNIDMYDKHTYIKKDKVTDEKLLLILPCNSGARFGNYFLGGTYPYMKNNWRKCDIWMRNNRENIYFAAHSSVEFYFPDGNGAIVFEHENERVMSSDDKGVPITREFTYDKNEVDKFSIHKMVVDLKLGLTRALDYGFEKIVVILTPLAYKTGFVKAVDELDIWDKITMFDSRVGTVDYFMKYINLLMVKDITGIMYSPRFSYNFTDKSPVPAEFKYDNHKLYTDVNTFAVNKIMHGSKYKHMLPIWKEHENMPLNELIDLYKLPYNTALYV